MTRHGKKSSRSKLYCSTAYGLVCASAGFVTALVLTCQWGDALGEGYRSHGTRIIEHRAAKSKATALNRRIARARRTQTPEAVGSASEASIFARSEHEAKEKILAMLIEESGPVAPPSVEDFSCTDELLPQERTELDAVLQTIERAKYELSVSFNSQGAEGKRHEVARQVLGSKRYMEWHTSCQQSQQRLQKQIWDRDIATAVTIISGHLGLDEESQNKMSELIHEQYRLREAAEPPLSVQADEHGELSLPTSPEEVDPEAVMQAEEESMRLERGYVARFKELLGPERWTAYRKRFVDTQRYGWSQLDWEAHATLFGSNPEIFSEDVGSTPSASESTE